VSADNKFHTIIQATAENRSGQSGEIDANDDAETKPANSQSSSPSWQEPDLNSAETEMNMARVEEMKRAIRDGRFHVNAKVVATKLIETVKELLTAHGA
jgi:negative regulator of flagellin synthesis FlgM